MSAIERLLRGEIRYDTYYRPWNTLTLLDAALEYWLLRHKEVVLDKKSAWFDCPTGMSDSKWDKKRGWFCDCLD